MLEQSLLSEEEINWCKTKAGHNNQIIFGLMLVHFKESNKFPSIDDISMSQCLISSVSKALYIVNNAIVEFNWKSRTVERYRQEIRMHFGFSEAADNDSFGFIEFLITEVLPNDPSKEALNEEVKIYFQNKNLECFKSKQLSRYIASAKHQFEQRFFNNVVGVLNKQDKDLIVQMLSASNDNKGAGHLRLADFKKDIPGARLKNINREIQKVTFLQQLPLDRLNFLKSVKRGILLKYYDRIMALPPSDILKFTSLARYSMMAIFCYVRSQLLLDSLTDSFTKLIHRMRTSAESFVDKNILKDVKRVDGKFDILERLAQANANNPKAVIEDVVYPDIPRDLLLELIKDLRHRGKWYQGKVREKIHSNYAHGSRTVLLSLLRLFDFKEDHVSYKPILDAIAFIKANQEKSTAKSFYLKMPPLDKVIPDTWRAMVVCEISGRTRVNKHNYEIAVLEQLKSFLGFKAIWVNGSYRFRNPNEDTPQDFEGNRDYYYDLLGLPLDKKAFTKNLKRQLKQSLSSLNRSIPDNDLVTIRPSSTNKNICIHPSAPQAEPNNIEQLQLEIANRWSTINLIDILKECDLLINFTEQMETATKSSSIPTEELRRRLLLCLYGIGSNTGLKRISIANGEVSFNDLRYTKKRFINKFNVRQAIKMVVNSVLEARDPAIWGEATTAVACDSTQVSAWDQNVLNEWHHRYKSKGVMIYWHVDKKALCIYSQLKTCSSSEVGSMIKGVIDHDTKMNMDEVFVDTHGQSVVGFAVSNLLGFDLLPRLKAINKQKICGVASNDKDKYKNISLIMKGSINWKLIEDNYDDVVKHMAALKLGIVEPSVLVKRFSRDNYNHPIYKALMEIGKAQKSIFLCKYLESAELRIEINEGLNVVERLNHVMDFIFYGKLGEMKTNKVDDQELSVLCLHLLQACMVYINTLIIQQILSEPHWQNQLTPEDHRALTPLFSGHINPYGLFPIDFNQRIENIFSISPISNEVINDEHKTHTSTREGKAIFETA